MSKTKIRTKPSREFQLPDEVVAKPLVKVQDDADSEDDDISEDDVEMEEGPEEIDAEEQELERLLFGDSAGFREGLRDLDDDEDEQESEDADDDATTGLEGIDDAALFFTDADGDGIPQPVLDDEDEDESDWKRTAAWEDSDDERMMVSLANQPRLRKLRNTEAEDVVSGKEYARRLRRQFELLNPAPEWAQTAHDQRTKRRRLSQRDEDGDDQSDQSDAEEGMDLDDALPSAAPLSKMLQGAGALVRSTGAIAGRKRKLRPEVIDIQRQKDVPGIQPSAITSLSVHPKLPLLLSSGPSATLYLHQLQTSPPAPVPNPLLTSLHIRGSQLSTTAFHPTDSRIFLSARRKYFHVWDLESGAVAKISRTYGHSHEQKSMERFKLSPDGRYMALLGTAKKGGGVVNVLDAATLQWVAQVRIESRGGIADFAWWRAGGSSGPGLCVAGKNGEVTEWSLAAQAVVARWQDEGAVGTTTIALGGQHDLVKSAIGTDRWVVVGSSSGVVNIYDRKAWLTGSSSSSTTAASKQQSQQQQQQIVPDQPKPTRTLDHLTTPTSHLAFSADGQILAVASKWKRDALRLVHLPSCTVFKNWPTAATPLGRITGVTFVPGDLVENEDVHSLLAVANEQGKIRLWEIR